MAVEISSDTLIGIDHHFRVSAGPGAGKTHWLALHVSNVLRHSKRLGKMGRVACLSYTNVGADTLLGRLQDGHKKIMSATIHSFLYSYIVKPYFSFVAEETGFPVDMLDSPDDRIQSDYKTIEAVLKEAKQPYVDVQQAIRGIKQAKWTIDADGNLACQTRWPVKAKAGSTYNIRQNVYGIYKRHAWKNGYLHYDDVIYFSYRLISKHPFIGKALAVQFPYMFVDEFQDTNPIQARIIKTIGENGAIVGIIGDKAQSIYGFLGADPSQFTDFSLQGLVDYHIKDNRRSTIEIVNLLNIVRPDFQQRSLRNEHGENPCILVGNFLDCYRKAIELSGGEEVQALSYRNLEANILKRQVDDNVTDSRLLDNFVDSDVNRRDFVVTWIKAIEHARMGQIGAALKFIHKIVNNDDALSGLKEALDDYQEYCDGTLLDFYQYLYDKWEGLKSVKKGKSVYNFYVGHSYKEASLCVNYEEDESGQRTIHKAKGDEFKNVLVLMPEEKALEILLKPNLDNEDSYRVYYVAMSRARDRLFISVPTISQRMRDRLARMQVNVEDV